MGLTNDEKAYLWREAKQAVKDGESRASFVLRIRGFKISTLRTYYHRAEIMAKESA